MKWLRLFAAISAFLAPTLHAGEPWVTLSDCHYVPNNSNDGDSFHVKAGEKEYIFRLYFVDAPEIESVKCAASRGTGEVFWHHRAAGNRIRTSGRRVRARSVIKTFQRSYALRPFAYPRQSGALLFIRADGNWRSRRGVGR